jgi:hypothetical protein
VSALTSGRDSRILEGLVESWISLSRKTRSGYRFVNISLSRFVTGRVSDVKRKQTDSGFRMRTARKFGRGFEPTRRISSLTGRLCSYIPPHSFRKAMDYALSKTKLSTEFFRGWG